jgi:hypothetical protein
MRGESILRFSTGSDYFVPVIPAQAGIQEFEERTGFRLAPGRRAGAHSNVQAMKQVNTQSEKKPWPTHSRGRAAFSQFPFSSPL